MARSISVSRWSLAEAGGISDWRQYIVRPGSTSIGSGRYRTERLNTVFATNSNPSITSTRLARYVWHPCCENSDAKQRGSEARRGNPTTATGSREARKAHRSRRANGPRAINISTSVRLYTRVTAQTETYGAKAAACSACGGRNWLSSALTNHSA